MEQRKLPFMDLETKNSIFRPIQYMGSKMKLVKQIHTLVEEVSEGGGFCDLFTGSGVVSNYMSQFYTVYSCDIQEYSKAITTALLQRNSQSTNDCQQFIQKCLSSSFYKDLEENLSPLISLEKNTLAKAKDGHVDALISFTQNTSLYIHQHNPSQLSPTTELLEAKNKYLSSSVAGRANITFLYGGVYFSFEQTLLIDTILHCMQEKETVAKNLFLAALLSTASEIGNTVGKQFAQPMKLLSKTKTPKKLQISRTLQDRTYSVQKYFLHYCGRYLSSSQNNNRSHQVHCESYEEFLTRDLSRVSCFYADPPYTIDHYSRFYHVLETIALNDRPKLNIRKDKGKEVVMNGLYRDDRHQSPFCIPSQVKGAFETMVKGCSQYGKPLIVSYSPFDEATEDRARLLSLGEIKSICLQYYQVVNIHKDYNHEHKRLHSNQKTSQKESNEVFIVCSNGSKS